MKKERRRGESGNKEISEKEQQKKKMSIQTQKRKQSRRIAAIRAQTFVKIDQKRNRMMTIETTALRGIYVSETREI